LEYPELVIVDCEIVVKVISFICCNFRDLLLNKDKHG